VGRQIKHLSSSSISLTVKGKFQRLKAF